MLAGSTRIKAGTAQKLILNTISTAAMVRLGNTFGNLMVDVVASNAKLRAGARRAVEFATEASSDEAECGPRGGAGRDQGRDRLVLRVEPEEARARLDAAGGVHASSVEQR